MGGMGILDIATHCQALLMKYLHKFLNKMNTPWVNIIWETYYQENLPGERMVGSFGGNLFSNFCPSIRPMLYARLEKGIPFVFCQIIGQGNPCCRNSQNSIPLLLIRSVL
jgi:hypothetical protein